MRQTTFRDNKLNSKLLILVILFKAILQLHLAQLNGLINFLKN